MADADPHAEPDERRYDAALMRRLLQYIAPYRWLALLAVLLLLATAGLTLVGPLLTQRALDVAVPARDDALLRTLALLFLGALVLEFVLDYAQAYLTAWMGQRVMGDLRLQVFSHLQRLSVSYFDRHPVGRLMTRVTSDVETLNELFSSGVVTVFGDVFTLAAITGMMLLTDWRLALVAFAVMPVMYLSAVTFRRHVRSSFRDIRARVARLNAFLQEHLSGLRVVQLFGREQAEAAAFAAVNRDHLQAHLRSITVYAIFFPVVEFLTTVALALLLWYGGLRVLGGTLTVGVLAAFIQLTRRFFQPLQDLSEKYNLLQSAMASSERIFQLLDTTPEVRSPAAPRALAQPVRGQVAFEHVWFRYRAGAPGADEGWVLRDVSFTARPGQTLALVGHTGAGKTTILSLLLRYYDPERGRITIDGVDLRELDLATVRGLIGFVQQDLFLFTGDIERNLVLDSGRGPAAARQAAERVGASRFIERLPSGYGHVLGERGRSLSVGERQLLSFARALAQDPRILVLDEATSSVDAEAEAQIQRAVTELMVGRTSLVVAHRLSTILHADEILVMHHGEIRERGTHRALLAQGGLYERLYRLQLQGQEVQPPLSA
ncbi:MAG: ABC transporter ATP-binding protein [Gemmatimonadetes bacterium]|nr:ABC transporter ATP-binding protein [Gemmatimonadota bacterium]MBK7785986.1 ABC transporter ATP-binding protein [Gemmatimonadota bacterium]MBP9200148.1 ABC transporter ATP-binding protein [Gemmatimonadales bacterium]